MLVSPHRPLGIESSKSAPGDARTVLICATVGSSSCSFRWHRRFLKACLPLVACASLPPPCERTAKSRISGELLRAVTVVQSCRRAPHRIEERDDFPLDPFRVRLDDHSPPVAGITGPPRKPSLFQPVNHARDRAGREPGAPGQFSRRDRPASRQDSRTLVVGDIHPQPVGNRLVKHDRHRAGLAHLLDQERLRARPCRERLLTRSVNPLRKLIS